MSKQKKEEQEEQRLQQEINSRIYNNYKNINDLFSSLGQIPLDNLKEILVKHTTNLPLKEKRQFKFMTYSINELFPADLMQKILGYDPFGNCTRKRVCKEWQKFIDLNETRFYKTAIEYIKKNSIVKYDSSINNIWVFNNLRISGQLNDRETNLKFKDVFSDLRAIIRHKEFKSGDIIFIHSGLQEFGNEGIQLGIGVTWKKEWEWNPEPNDYNAVVSIHHDCTLFGVDTSKKTKIRPAYDGVADGHSDFGDRAFIEIGNDPGCTYEKPILNTPCVHLENLYFDMLHVVRIFEIHPDCTLLLKNCHLVYDCAGITHQGRDLKIENCTIQGPGAGIEIYSNSNDVCVSKSLFLCENECYGGIQIHTRYEKLASEWVKLKCIDNEFEGAYWPIIEKNWINERSPTSTSSYRTEPQLFTLTNNNWKQTWPQPENKPKEKIERIQLKLGDGWETID